MLTKNVQAQFATGFGNWTGMDTDPSTWPNGTAGNAPIDTHTFGGALSSGMSMPSNQPPIFPGNDSTGGYPMLEWLNSMSAYDNMTYNEDEWYQ